MPRSAPVPTVSSQTEPRPCAGGVRPLSWGPLAKKFLTCSKCRALLEPGTKRCPYCQTDARHLGAPSAGADAAATMKLGSWILGVIVVLYGVMVILDPAKDARAGALEPSGTAADLFGASNQFFVAHCGQYWRFLTAIFVHLGLFHLVANSLCIFILMPLAAGTFGSARTTCIWFGAGLAGSALSHYVGNSGAGASGAVCGIIAALAVYGRRRGGMEGRELTRRMLFWAVIILVYGHLRAGIDNAGHGGGFVAGAALGWLAGGLQPRGGRVDRAWRWAARAAVAGAIVVGAVFWLPNIVRGLDRRDAQVFQTNAANALERIGEVVDSGDAERLPESFPKGPGGTEGVHDAGNAALRAVREESASAAAALDAAWMAFLRWEDEAYCRYGLEPRKSP